LISSVADPGCLSRILIFTHPGSRISDPKTATKEWGEKNSCHTFFWIHKFHKVENYFTFERLKKRIWVSFHRIIELFTQKIVTKLSKVWVWDPGSGIRDPKKPIPDPAVKKAQDPGSGSATLLESISPNGFLGFLNVYKFWLRIQQVHSDSGSRSGFGFDP
jgi:hypothetical protein